MPDNIRPKTGGYSPVSRIAEYAHYWKQWFERGAAAIAHAGRE